MARGSTVIKAEKTSSAWSLRFLRIMLIGGGMTIGLVCLGIIAAEAWDYSNSVAFCSDTCHDVHPEEPIAYQDSYHARVKCTECHMGRATIVRGVILKSSHIRHLPAIIFDNYERPLVSETMRPASESCEKCHFPAAFHDDMAREIEHFLPDAENTGKLTYLLLRTGAGTQGSEQGFGIHWHVTNPVEYIATDNTKQDIRWVRTTLPDGRTMEYNDMTNPLSPEEIARAEKRTMDCVDCHNRIGHPFASPDILIDKALADGRLSTEVPFIKREMLALLTASYATQEEALAAADSLRTRYSTEYPEIAAAYAVEIEQAVRLAREFQTRLVFEEPGVSWQSFFDNTGHRNSDGCFRCHDGQHLTAEGEDIPLQCNICHSIPVTVDRGDDPPEIAIAASEEPDTHLQSRFVSNHRFQVDESCADCHGEVFFGADDSSFCANSACHGQNWPTLSLAENFAHPVSLQGKHDGITCDSCHDGSVGIVRECASCHEPPPDHLDGACETCHTPAGWLEVIAPDLTANSSAPHSIDLNEDCMVCHDPWGQNWPAPTDHTVYSNGQCSLCHDSAISLTMAWDASLTGHILEGEHVQASCIECHESGVFQGTPQECAPCHGDDDVHAGELGQACAECHIPAGWTLANVEHALTAFPLNGKHQSVACADCHLNQAYEGTPRDCWSCHEADDTHSGKLGQNCAECHTVRGWQGATFDHALTQYPLRGEHKQAACAQCHPGNQYAGTPQNCYACHQANDKHNGQFGQACAQCHTPKSWQGANFDHNTAAYSLTGRHTQVACVQCHPGGQYRGTPQNCYACHQENDKHNGQFGQACAQCHTPNSWQGASFDHNTTGYSLTGRHTQVGCVQCHPGNQYSGTPQSCVACHQANDVHNGRFGPDCAQCHSTGGWQGASVNHDLTAFPLTGAHAGLGCASCHGNGIYQGTPTNCAACHGEPGYHAGVLGSDCASCHDTGGWLPARYNRSHSFNMNHEDAGGSCRTCHPSTLASYSCDACHDGPPDDD